MKHSIARILGAVIIVSLVFVGVYYSVDAVIREQCFRLERDIKGGYPIHPSQEEISGCAQAGINL